MAAYAGPVLLARENMDPESAVFVEVDEEGGAAAYEEFPSVEAAARAVGFARGALSRLLGATGAYFDLRDELFLKFKDLSSFPAPGASNPTLWSELEDRVVRGVCRLLGPGRWEDVARVLGCRAAGDVQARWERALSGRGAGAETAQAALPAGGIVVLPPSSSELASILNAGRTRRQRAWSSVGFHLSGAPAAIDQQFRRLRAQYQGRPEEMRVNDADDDVTQFVRAENAFAILGLAFDIGTTCMELTAAFEGHPYRHSWDVGRAYERLMERRSFLVLAYYEDKCPTRDKVNWHVCERRLERGREWSEEEDVAARFLAENMSD